MLEELKAIFKSPKLWVTMIGVALIPTLYNLIFLSSMWDPYGNVKNLPVAVVNEDKSATLNNQTLSIGKNMVDSMSKSDNLDYHFVSSKTAKKGLKNGDYYMIITLPKDLSAKAATLLTDNPEQATIDYQTTKGRSFVASKMSDSAMTKLKEKVSKNITKTYTTAIFESLSSLQSGLVTASSGSSQLTDGSKTLESGSQTLTTNLNTLSSSSQTFAEGASTLNSGLTTYTNGVQTLANGASQLDSNSQTLLSGVSQLASSSSQIQQLVDGANELTSGLQELSSKTTLSSEQQSQINSLISGLPQLNSAIQSLNSSVSSLSVSGVDTSSLSTYLTTIATQAQNILTYSSTDKANEIKAIEATSAYQSLTSDQQAEITDAVNSTSSSTETAAKAILENVSSMKTALQALQDLSSSLSQLSQLQTAIGQIATNANTALPGAASALTTLSSGISQVNSALTSQIVPGSSQVASGVATLQSQLSSGASQLLSGLTTYTNGVSSISSGAAQLVANSSQLTSGTSQLESGAEQIASGSSQLAEGSNTLTSGLTTLSTNLSTLSDSLSKASNQLSLVSTNKSNAKAISNPVKTKHTDNDNVPTNGVGMAPYMMSVALMVAALSTNVIFAKALSGKEPKNRFEWARNKLVINGIIATVAATFLYFAIRLLGVVPNFEWRTYLLTLLAAWTMMALVTALVGWDNRYGSFLSLIILLLQLGSSAGTYPIELSGKFFQIIQPYLPMTYTVSGLRQTISMTGNISQQSLILFTFMVGFMILAICIYRKQEN